MYFTPFFPFFFLMMLYSICSPKRWAYMMGISSFFLGASPVLVSAGGRVAGMAPAYFVMMAGIIYVYSILYTKRRMPNNQVHQVNQGSLSIKVLILFTIIGVSGAIFLPRLFEGTGVLVLSSDENGGLDGGFGTPLVPRSTNFFQAFYLVCDLAMFAIIRYFILEKILERKDLINGIYAGAFLSLGLGFYQVLVHYFNLPWPDGIINSNLAYKQWYEATAGNLPRISSTFKEPSIFSMHFLGMLGLFGLGLQKKFFGVLALLGLLLSTSSTAYFGLIGLLLIWAILDLPNRVKITLFTALMLTCLIGIVIAWDQSTNDGKLLDQMVLNKFQSFSGKMRMRAESMALDTFYDTWGFGAGVGSMRTSSLFTTLLATAGFPGVLTFCFFICLVLHSLWGSKDEFDRALFLGIIGLIIGWLISVPDIATPLFWILAALTPSESHKETVLNKQRLYY